MKLKELLTEATTHKIIKNGKEIALVNMKAGKYGYSTFVTLSGTTIKKIVALEDEDAYQEKNGFTYTRRGNVISIEDNTTKRKTNAMTVNYEDFVKPIPETM